VRLLIAGEVKWVIEGNSTAIGNGAKAMAIPGAGRLRVTGKRCRLQKTSTGFLSHGRNILEFHGKPLPIKRFKDAIHDIIREAEDILW
jgi:hypothetical protein